MAILGLLLYLLGIWIIFISAAIIIGALKTFLIAPKLGKLLGQIICTILLICVILYGAYLFVRNLEGIPSRDALLLIGACWVILTWLFELVFLSFIRAKPGRELLAEYDMFRGRAGGLVLLVEFIAPIIIYFLLR